MAADEVLLETAARQNLLTLRFYQWSEPTLSLGYFQRYEERLEHRPSRNCMAVRRSTGGGAILHDVELTYSLAIPVAHPLALDTSVLYQTVHEALIASLASYRALAEFAGENPVSKPEPFLCFARRTPLDVVSNGSKICGSAQRKRQGGVLQHGSLLLAASENAPELPGVLEVAGVKLPPNDFAQAWAGQITARLGIDAKEGQLDSAETDAVRELTLSKHALHSWVRKR
jgi:lipoate-protein ligase A